MRSLFHLDIGEIEFLSQEEALIIFILKKKKMYAARQTSFNLDHASLKTQKNGSRKTNKP